MYEVRSAEAWLQHFVDSLATGRGMIAVILFLALAATVAAVPRLKWLVLALMLYMATLGFSRLVWFDNTLSFPLQELRLYGRAISGALLVTLLLPTIMEVRGWRINLILGVTTLFFVFQLVYAGRVLMEGDLARGLGGALIYALMFVTLGVGLSRWLQTVDDVHWALRAVVLAAILVVAGSIYQLLINPSAIVWLGRLFGTTSNPQHLAMILAMALLPACYLLMQPSEPKWWRIIIAGTVGFMVIFLIWTGSRTGILMAATGLALLFRARIGKFVGVGIITTIFVFAGLQLFAESVETAERLVSTADTRSHVWKMLLDDFRESPWIGIVREDLLVKENAYLSTAARMGLMGLIPLGATLLLGAIALAKLQRLRRQLGQHSLLADLVTAGIISVAVGAMFEGLLLGTMTYQVFVIYIHLAILTFLLDVKLAQEAMIPERREQTTASMQEVLA